MIDENRTLSLGRKGPQELEGIHRVRTREIGRVDAAAKTKILNSRQTERTLSIPKLAVTASNAKTGMTQDLGPFQDREDLPHSERVYPKAGIFPRELLDAAEPEAPRKRHGRLRLTNRTGRS